MSANQRCYYLLFALLILTFPACQSDGHLCILGYTTRPVYDTSIRTVRVGIFKNETYIRGLEFELTKAVIREIEEKTPYKVVQANQPADTELQMSIVTHNKRLTTFNQLGEVREAETTMGVEVVWKDLRPGQIGDTLVSPLPPDPALPPPPVPEVPDSKVLVQSMAVFRPELGQSLRSAQFDMVNKLAVQIVSMMEKKW